MTLDKRHMAGSLAVLGCAITYNVWVFTRPADRSTAGAAPVAIVGAAPSAAGGDSAGAAAIDTAPFSSLADVATDRVPTWPRDPFDNLQDEPQVVVSAAAPASAPAVEPDPVVASILYSAGRRLAVIDGRIVRPGERAGTAMVIDILPKAVVLELPDGDRRTVELQAPSAAGPRR
jgi:hypothetical protein